MSLRPWLNQLQKRCAKGIVQDESSLAFQHDFGSLLYAVRAMKPLCTRDQGHATMSEILASPAFVTAGCSSVEIASSVCRAVTDLVTRARLESFRQAHAQTMMRLLAVVCPQTEKDEIQIAIAIATRRTFSESLLDALPLFRRLVTAIIANAEFRRYRDHEISLLCTAMQPFLVNVLDVSEEAIPRSEIQKVVTLFSQRYSQSSRATSLLGLSVLSAGPHMHSVATEACKTPRGQAALCEAFFRHFSHPLSSKGDGKTFTTLIPFVERCVSEQPNVLNSVAQSFMTTMFIFYQRNKTRRRINDHKLMTKFIFTLFYAPVDTNVVPRWPLLRPQLLIRGGPLRPTRAELEQLILQVQSISLPQSSISAIKALRCICLSADGDVLDMIRHALASVLSRYAASWTMTELVLALRSMCDARFPVGPAAVSTILERCISEPLLTVTDISLMMKIVFFHAPADVQSQYVTELVKRFVRIVPSSSVQLSHIMGMCEIVMRNNSDSNEFLERMTEYFDLIKKSNALGVHPVNATELPSTMHCCSIIVLSGRPLLHRGAGRKFFFSFGEMIVHVITVFKEPIPVSLFRRYLTVLSSLTVLLPASSGRPFQTTLRPALHHIFSHHEVTGESIGGFAKAIIHAYREARVTEAARLQPMLNLLCNLVVKHQYCLHPLVAVHLIILLARRGSVKGDVINRSHTEAIRACANAITHPSHIETTKVIIESSIRNAWLSELFVLSQYIDVNARAVLYDLFLNTKDAAFDEKALSGLAHSMVKGDVLWVS